MSEQAKRTEEVQVLIDEIREETCSEDDEGVPFYDAGLADNIIRKWASAALQEAERRGVEKGLGEIRKWASVAFYPGPDEREAFHEGYMAGIGEADRVAARLLSEKEEDRE